VAHEVVLIPGDGTGPELTEATRRVLEATGVEFEWDVREAGEGVMARHGGNPLPSDVLDAIREELAAIKVPGAHEATAEQTWQDLDVDSLDLVELVKALEDRYEVTIADGRLKGIKTVGDAVALVQELAQEGAPA
jgi:acyl carrier protein